MSSWSLRDEAILRTQLFRLYSQHQVENHKSLNNSSRKLKCIQPVSQLLKKLTRHEKPYANTKYMTHL